ncbi:MAG TPA: class I SAM-dependent methyltransferase [Aggregatilineales bacterium]|nr:class I SAM-dependent methyltransferase [Aggregatilineales bacterium]
MIENACRSCGTPDLKTIVSLGKTPLANALLTKEQLGQPEELFPLDVVYCSACTLVQITCTVPPEKLFREYLYFSSFSDTVIANAAAITDRLIETRHLDAHHRVVEIASNDGYLLKHYQRRGVGVLGIEPAVNIARVAQEQGIETLGEFFDEALGQRLRDSADVFHANNVLAHVADLNGVVAGLRWLLKPEGIAVIETPYVKDLIDRVEFDTIYHEHLCYYSLTALTNLFNRHHLTVIDVERLPIHGGSLRVFVQHEGMPVEDRVPQLLAEESAWGVHDFAFYRDFGERIETLKRDVVTFLAHLKQHGKRIAVYGASAKGSTLLNCFGIGAETLDFVVDRSTVKQGLYTPGTRLPIYPPAKLLETMPDYVLLLSWNFADEVLAQQAEYRQRGGQFILPIPEVRVV